MEYPVTATVTSVIVYPDRARVTCRGRVDLPAGQHHLLVGDLPLALETESVRAAGQGKARVRLRGVDVNRRHYADAPATRVRELEAEARRLENELQVVADTQAGREAALRHLEGLRSETEQYARALARGQTTPEDQTRLMAFFQEQDEQARADLRELAASEEGLRRELEKVQAELAQLRSARPRQRYEARLEVEVLNDGMFEPEVSYIVARAGWEPLYDLRLGVEGTPALSATYLAQIHQETGQDWTGVSLSVSTARPALNQRFPELRPWFVDELRPQPRMYAAAAPAMAKGNRALADALEEPAYEMAMAAPAPAAMEVVAAQAEENGTAVSFSVGGSIDIPGDGAPHKTILGQFELSPQLDYLTAPRHTDAVYRRAKVVNTSAGPLLPGTANLYVGDEFIGQNRLAYTPGQGELELLLGVEERIAVEREMVRREVDKRFLRDQRQLVYGYEIRVHNHLGTPATVTVQDQFPVSRHEQIKIKLEKVSLTPVEQSELAILEWKLDLAPGEEKTIRYEYSVEHPRQMRVAGLID